MQECEMLVNCRFFAKYKDSVDLVEIIIKEYCRGLKQGKCEHKKYRMEHNCAPPDNMLPSGGFIHFSE